MYFMYVDESGDPGFPDPDKPPEMQPSQHYILTGFIIPAEEWRNYLTAIVDIRKQLKTQFGLPVRTELHGAELINPRGNLIYKSAFRHRRARTDCYHVSLSSFCARLPRAKIVNIHVNKRNPRYPSTVTVDDLEELAWSRLAQRFQTYLQKTSGNSLGMIFADETNEVKIRRLIRKMRVYNPVPSQFGGSLSMPITNIVEDPVMRNSEHSYFVQIADLTSHALYRKLYPKGSYRQYNVDKLFDLLDGILLKEASRSDAQGIVHL
jgi:hypothetical protein